MSQLGDSQFESLFLDDTRLIDVRAPVEFAAGSIPGAVNLPLLNDEERHEVGLTYKHQGQAAAIELGQRLVSGAVREQRTEAWLRELKAHPGAVIYCFRGGLRSQTVQGWLGERGVERPIVAGGFKALRRFLLESLLKNSERLRFEVVSGPTGSGKTEYLRKSGRPFIDLEAIARHRGSAFGKMEEAQPNQIDFENAVAVELLKLARLAGPVLIEDESLMIGQRLVPAVLFEKMQESPRIVLEVPFEERVENIFKDYVLNSSLGKEQDVRRFAEFRHSVQKISRKLGGLRAQEVLQDLENSERAFLSDRSLDSNRVWIAKLLKWYYDPLYNPKRDGRRS